MTKEIQREVKVIRRDCLRNGITVREAVDSIDERIGGITRVEFKEGMKFKVHNHNAVYNLHLPGVPKRQRERYHAMAAVAYDQARHNGNYAAGEVHISKSASTKHHQAGIDSLIDKYAA